MYSKWEMTFSQCFWTMTIGAEGVVKSMGPIFMKKTHSIKSLSLDITPCLMVLLVRLLILCKTRIWMHLMDQIWFSKDTFLLHQRTIIISSLLITSNFLLNNIISYDYMHSFQPSISQNVNIKHENIDQFKNYDNN
jgi:hypothetical protein